MRQTRRDILKKLGLTLSAAPFVARNPFISPLDRRSHGIAHPGTDDRRLFFEEGEIARIRKNAETPLLKSAFQEWRSLPADEAASVITKTLETGDLLYDWGAGLEQIYRQATLTLITDDSKHRDLTLLALDTLHKLPDWDYLLDGGKDVLGIMRASKATTATLLSLEVLGDGVSSDLRHALLRDVAEKGCVPCALTIHQMNHPEDVKGWGVDEVQRKVNEWDMSNWPRILAVNNLRAIPTMGLGLGALALEGQDERAGVWYEAAVDSSRRFLDLFEDDGSYFEGISYVSFAFRTLFLFFEADYRLRGDTDWINEANFDGITNYIVALQNGRNADGTPDIINISDSNRTVFTTVPSWIANHSDSQLAAYAAHEFVQPAYFADFLWYRPGREGQPPPDDLKNVRMDLGWIVCRTGWDPDDTVLSFRSGGPMNHEHADRNSFLLKSKGERLLTEHFGASYQPTQPNWLLRLPIAHNSVLVDGQGHQYHHGEEGTNASQASATIDQYEDHGDTVFWTSDATSAYRLVDNRIQLVRRSVIIRKPWTVILLDEVGATEPVEIQILLHPDNRDDAAGLEILTGGEFAILRPNARLRGRSYSDTPFQIERRKLDLPPDFGEFPYLEIGSHANRSIAILTTLEVGDDSLVEVTTTETGWKLKLDREDFATIQTGEGVPAIKV